MPTLHARQTGKLGHNIFVEDWVLPCGFSMLAVPGSPGYSWIQRLACLCWLRLYPNPLAGLPIKYLSHRNHNCSTCGGATRFNLAGS
jgi:hypothetical protein